MKLNREMDQWKLCIKCGREKKLSEFLKIPNIINLPIGCIQCEAEEYRLAKLNALTRKNAERRRNTLQQRLKIKIAFGYVEKRYWCGVCWKKASNYKIKYQRVGREKRFILWCCCACAKNIQLGKINPEDYKDQWISTKVDKEKKDFVKKIKLEYRNKYFTTLTGRRLHEYLYGWDDQWELHD